MNNLTNKNNKIPIFFTSDDSEGSNRSYVSSKDLELNEVENKHNYVQLIKDKMYHYFLENPELKEGIQFEKIEEKDLERLEDEQKQEAQGGEREEKIISQNRGGTYSAAPKVTFIQNKAGPTYGPQPPKKTQQHHSWQWKKIGNNIIKECRKSDVPSVEYINHRLNLFRQQVIQPDIFELLEIERKMTNDFQDNRNNSVSAAEKDKKNIEQIAKTKMKKETGNVQYYSYKKIGQFDFKIRNQEKELHKNLERQKKKEIEQQERNRINLVDSSKNNNYSQSKKDRKIITANPKQRAQSEKSKTLNNVFDRLCGGGGREPEDEQELRQEENYRQQFKTKAGEEFYKSILPFKNNLRQLKLNALSQYKAQKQQAIDNFDLKNSVLNQNIRFNNYDGEFNLYFPDFNQTKFLSPEEINSIFNQDMMQDHKDDVSTFLLRKVDKIMNSDIIKYWKHLQDPQQFQ